jgi:hypothetical protein
MGNNSWERYLCNCGGFDEIIVIYIKGDREKVYYPWAKVKKRLKKEAWRSFDRTEDY